MYKRKVVEMKDQIQRETAKTEAHDRRRRCEIEGISSDLSNMKRKVEFYQKYIAKLKQLVHEDSNAGGRSEEMDDIYN